MGGVFPPRGHVPVFPPHGMFFPPKVTELRRSPSSPLPPSYLCAPALCPARRVLSSVGTAPSSRPCSSSAPALVDRGPCPQLEFKSQEGRKPSVAVLAGTPQLFAQSEQKKQEAWFSSPPEIHITEQKKKKVFTVNY